MKNVPTIIKLIIFIPMAVLTVALYLHMSGLQNLAVRPSTTPETFAGGGSTVKPDDPNITPGSQPIGSPLSEIQNGLSSKKTPNFPKDLDGPYRCTASDKDTSVLVLIKKKQVYVKFSHENITAYALLKGDCLYRWQSDTNQGQKICKLSPFISLFETVSQIPFISGDIMTNMFAKLQGSMNVSTTMVTTLFNSCKKEDIDDSYFQIPGTIVFTEEALNQKAKP